MEKLKTIEQMKQEITQLQKELTVWKERESEALLKIQDQLLSKIRQQEDTIEFGYKEGTPLQFNKERIRGLQSQLQQRDELLERLKTVVKKAGHTASIVALDNVINGIVEILNDYKNLKK